MLPITHRILGSRAIDGVLYPGEIEGEPTPCPLESALLRVQVTRIREERMAWLDVAREAIALGVEHA